MLFKKFRIRKIPRSGLAEQIKNMSEQHAQFSFLYNYILNFLSFNGYGDLSEDLESEIVSQLSNRAQARVGEVILPMLNEKSAEEMLELAKRNNVLPEEWLDFWQKNIDNFSEIVENTLRDFLKDIGNILDKNK